METPMMRAATGASVVLVAALLAAGDVATTTGLDWPQWRGPVRDGVSRETGLLPAWPDGGPPEVWRATGVGAGYSSMAIAGGRLYTLGARGDTESLIVLDAATGRKVWEAANGRRFRNDRGDGPRSTPTVDGTRVFVLGSSGDLSAFDAGSGARVWSVNVLREFGGTNANWGLSESPLVVDDRIVVNAGGRGASVVALRKSDGRPIWKSESDGAAYSSAVVAEAGGVRQAVVFTSRRVIGVHLDDGRLLWEYASVSNRVANIATPIVRGDRVFVSSDYGTGAALLRLARAGESVAATEVWFSRNMRNHHSSSVLVGDHLYGFSSAILTAMRFDTGEVAWRDRSVGKGSLVAADGRLYLFSEDGVAGLAEITPEGYRERGRFRLASTGALPTWSHPVVSNGRLYLRDQDTIYAYDVRAR
ncbi:MAG: PQQ-binding-like beta-propeller repeat protein [Acidobacteria bacterium]|nr:PQQ-binding-like beta-propeller repeat protein [Acidobacteriota bacterium]